MIRPERSIPRRGPSVRIGLRHNLLDAGGAVNRIPNAAFDRMLLDLRVIARRHMHGGALPFAHAMLRCRSSPVFM